MQHFPKLVLQQSNLPNDSGDIKKKKKDKISLLKAIFYVLGLNNL